MDLKGLDIAIYLRKSRSDMEEEKRAAEYGKEYDTLEKHRAELLAVAKREQHNILDIYEEVVSGEFITGRPEMQKLLDAVKQMKYEAVLVVDIDRLGRGDKMDQGRIERAFRESQTLIITPTDIYDLNAESGEFSVEVKSFLSRMEYRMIKKRLQQGRIRSARSGKEVASKAPYGFKKGDGNILQIDEEKAKYVRLVYKWCAEGIGRVKSAEMLTDMKAPTPSGKPAWSHMTIRNILRNEKYKGDQVFGVRKFTRREDGSYHQRPAKPEEIARKSEAHPGIVSAELWQAAQEQMDRRRRLPKKKHYDLINPLAGMIRCKKCGNAIMANNPANRPNAYLYCGTPGCPTKMIAMNKVYNEVITQLSFILDNLKTSTTEQTASRMKDRVNLLEQQIHDARKLIEKINVRRERLYELLEDGTYTKELFVERSRTLQQEEAAQKETINDLSDQLQEAKVKLDLNENLAPTLESALSVINETPSIESRNRILKTVIREIRYRRDKEWTQPFQFDLEIDLWE